MYRLGREGLVLIKGGELVRVGLGGLPTLPYAQAVPRETGAHRGGELVRVGLSGLLDLPYAQTGPHREGGEHAWVGQTGLLLHSWKTRGRENSDLLSFCEGKD